MSPTGVETTAGDGDHGSNRSPSHPGCHLSSFPHLGDGFRHCVSSRELCPSQGEGGGMGRERGIQQEGNGEAWGQFGRRQD